MELWPPNACFSRPSGACWLVDAGSSYCVGIHRSQQGKSFHAAVAVLLLRLGREVFMREQKQRNWLAFADWLVVAASFLTLAVIVASLLGPGSRSFAVMFPRIATVTAIVLLLGYVPAILAHYRFLGGAGRTGPCDNPEPLEAKLVGLSAAAAVIAGIAAFVLG